MITTQPGSAGHHRDMADDSEAGICEPPFVGCVQRQTPK